MQYDDIIERLGVNVAGSIIEPHGVDVVAQHGQGLVVRQLMGRDAVFQRLGNADRDLHDGLTFGDPLVDHTSSYQRRRHRNYGDKGQNRKPDQQGQLGAQAEVTEEVHGLPRSKWSEDWMTSGGSL